MNIKIKKVRRALPEEWDEAWKKCDYTTYPHSREWAEIFYESSNRKMIPEPRLILFSDGKSAVIPLSYTLSFKGLVKNYCSTPEYLYGGWISKDHLSAEHARLLADYMLKKCGNLRWRINPFDENIFKTEITPTGEETEALDLSAGFATLSKEFSRGCVSKIHKAIKHGITIRMGSKLSDWQEYFKIYEDALSRWGKNARTPRHWRLFNEMYSRHSPNIQLWLAVHKGKIIAGGIRLYAKRHITAWQLATLKDYLSFSPANLLYYEVIKDACQRGYKWLDFLPSGNLEGVRAFKKSFGTKALHTHVIEVKSRKAALCKKISDIYWYKIRG